MKVSCVVSFVALFVASLTPGGNCENSCSPRVQSVALGQNMTYTCEPESCFILNRVHVLGLSKSLDQEYLDKGFVWSRGSNCVSELHVLASEQNNCTCIECVGNGQPAVGFLFSVSKAKLCKSMDVRMVSANETIGSSNLEVCYKGVWSLVKKFNRNAASIACKELGFQSHPVESVVTSPSTNLDNVQVIKNLKCTAIRSEANMTGCSVTMTTRSTNSLMTELVCHQSELCEEGALKLVDGETEQDGHVEVCINGVWGTLCSGHDPITGHVVCSRLGYHGNDNQWSNGPAVKPYLHGFLCEGWEQNISQCFDMERYLESSGDVCSGSVISCSDHCVTGEVRLVGGKNSTSGIVEICQDNRWGLIAEPGWTNINSAVICKQLGLSTGVVVEAGVFTRPRRLIHRSDVHCSGKEDKILDCASFLHNRSTGVKLMTKLDVVAVVCQVTPK